MIKALLGWLFPADANPITHAGSAEDMAVRMQRDYGGIHGRSDDDTEEIDTSEYLMRDYETLPQWRQRLGLDRDDLW